MAYQRPFLISMKKSDPQQPWGFRTFGGKEYAQPHVVEKVLEDSNAERCGLREGDEIIQIGRINVQDMSFGQVQEILARCGNKIEMFIIREDLLAPRKGKEPPIVKAVVHNPYNSPLNLYSTENIAETLAKQTEVLTEGHIVEEGEEEEGPENLSFKQKSAVFQLLEEQARQESVNQYHPKGSSPRKAVPPPPPKPRPPASQVYQNKENYYPLENSNIPQSPPHKTAYGSPPNDYYVQTNSVEYRKEEQKSVQYPQHQQQSQQTVRNVATNHIDSYDQFNNVSYKTVQKVEPTPPPRTPHSSQRTEQNMATAYKQQPQYYNQQYQEQSSTYHSQAQWQQQQQEAQLRQQQEAHLRQQQEAQLRQQQEAQLRQQQEAQHRQQQEMLLRQQHGVHQTQQQYEQKVHQQQQNQHQYVPHLVTKGPQQQQQKVESIFESAPQPLGEPIAYKAPPSQKHSVNWPPPMPQAQQNGRWSTPSPTPASPSRHMESVWPPKQPTAKDLPRSGFNPSVLREQGTGRRCVWPPPKPDDEFRSGRTTPQSPVSGRRITFNPSPSPPLTRRSPFGPMSPVTRRKDIAWPPPSPTTTTPTKTETFQNRPSPTLARKARFDEYVHQNTSNNVPTSYRPPPGTQHVQYC